MISTLTLEALTLWLHSSRRPLNHYGGVLQHNRTANHPYHCCNCHIPAYFWKGFLFGSSSVFLVCVPAMCLQAQEPRPSRAHQHRSCAAPVHHNCGDGTAAVHRPAHVPAGAAQYPHNVGESPIHMSATPVPQFEANITSDITYCSILHLGVMMFHSALRHAASQEPYHRLVCCTTLPAISALHACPGALCLGPLAQYLL
jgi:hypothetical protein